MRYYKDQFTIVEQEEIEIETHYGEYIVVASVETSLNTSGETTRRKYLTIYEIEENDEEKGFWEKLWQLLKSNYPILPRTFIPEEKQLEDFLNDWIINWELPKHQIAKVKQGGKKLRINYDKELEKRTKRAENQSYQYDNPSIAHWQYPDDMDRTFIKPHYKRGMHPHSQAQLKQNQKTS
jgi:hypothetical protein